MTPAMEMLAATALTPAAHHLSRGKTVPQHPRLNQIIRKTHGCIAEQEAKAQLSYGHHLTRPWSVTVRAVQVDRVSFR